MPKTAARHSCWPAPYLFALFFGFVTIGSALAADTADKRVALIIGNSKYSTAPLKNPVNDAKAMAKKLEGLGFEVIVKMDIGQREMTRAITAFGERLSSGSVGLFYYAGHGMQARGRNYLVPVDADITSEASVSSETVDVERVLDQLSNARLSMVILDACRNNPFERRFRSGAGSGLAQIDAPAGTLIAYATSPGKVALDGEGSNGTYTEALLRAMDMPGLRVEDVFKQVRISVLKATSNQQIPWESSSLTGDFLFKAALRPAVDTAEQARQEAQAKEGAALRDQMATLRAEIAKLREAPPPSPDRANSTQDQKKADADAAALREQLAAMNAEIIKLRQAPASPAANPVQQAQDKKQLDAAAAALRTQVASLNVELSKVRPARQPTAEEVAAWKPQLDKVEAARPNMTLASALAALLDVQSEAELAKLKNLQSFVYSRGHSSGFAIGIDQNGRLVWGGSSGHPYSSARATAVDLCAGAGGTNCKAVVVNGSFFVNDYIAVAKGLGNARVEPVRKAFLDTLAQPASVMPDPTFGADPSYRNAASYTFARVVAK